MKGNMRQNNTQLWSQLWRDTNKVLWNAATAHMPPRNFIRAELCRHVDRAKLLEKSAAIRMVRKTQSVSPIYRACAWIVEDCKMTFGQPITPPIDFSTPNTVNWRNLARHFAGIDIEHASRKKEAHTPDHYQIFVNAFAYAANAARIAGMNPEEFELEFIFTKHRWIVHGTDEKNIAKIGVNFFYISANPMIWNAIFAAIIKDDKPARKLAEQYATSTDAQAILAVYNNTSPLRIDDAYNLSQMFDELNRDYFNNALPKPMIAWTTRANYRTLGTYNFFWQMICISKILNDRRIPEIAVKFVLFHEMLHIKHGAYEKNSRFISHTAEFRADEKKFEYYEKAKEYLRQIQNLSSHTDQNS